MASILDNVTPDDPRGGTLLGDVKRGVGNMMTTSARAAQLAGVNLPSINSYGQQLIDQNPSQVNTVGDIAAHPIDTAREAIGSNAPQIAASVASGKTGQAIGGVIGTGVGALTRNPANIARFEQIGQKVGGFVGYAAPTFAQELGTVLQGQDQTGDHDTPKALLAATAATGLEQLGEAKVVKRLFRLPGAADAIANEGGSVIGGIAKEAGKTALTEGATEAAQTVAERVGSGQSLTDQDAANDIGVSTVEGAVGGLGIGGAAHGAEVALNHAKTGPASTDAPTQPGAPTETPEQAEAAPADVAPPTPAAPVVVDPSRGPLSNAVATGADAGDVAGVHVARASIPGMDGAATLPPEVTNPPSIEAPAAAVPSVSDLTQGKATTDPLDAPNFGLPEAPKTLPDDHPLLAPTIANDTPERQELRQSIVDQHFDNAKPVTDRAPIAYVMGGGGASGKGTALAQFKKQGLIPASGAVEIDPDKIKTGAEGFHGIPEYQELLKHGDSRAADVVHEESSQIARETMAQAAAGKYDMILDRTLGDPQKGVAELAALKAAGYEVRLYGVTTDPAAAVQRAVSRAQNSGRHVPMNALLQAHAGFSGAFENYANIADQAHLYDNDVEKGSSPVLIASKGEGSLAIEHPERYNNFTQRSGINAAANTIRQINPATAEQSAGEGTGSQPGPVQGVRSDDSGATGQGEGAAPGEVAAAAAPAGPNITVQKDGSAIIEGDRRQLAAQLKTAGIPAIAATAGVRVGAKHLDAARAALTPVKTQEQQAAARASVPAAEAQATAANDQTQTLEPVNVNPLDKDQMDSAPLGSWVRGPEVPGVQKPDLFQVRDVPLDNLHLPETDSAGQLVPEKQGYLERYANAMRNGEKFPNARGYELPDGRIKVVDGHRRAMAAREASLNTLRVAVSPIQQPTDSSVRASARSASGKPALPAERVTGEAQRLSKRWKDGPSVQVVPTFNDIPESVRLHLDPRADAAYDGEGTIYIAADRMTSGADIRRVLAHEAYAHYGVKGLLGPQFENFLARVTTLKDTDASVRKAADTVYQNYGELDPQAEADEIVAHMAENYSSLTGRAKLLMAQIIASAKDFVRNRLGLNLQWSSSDVLDMVSRAKQYVENGTTPPAQVQAGPVVEHTVPAAIRASIPTPPPPAQSFDSWTMPTTKLAEHLAAAAGDRLKAYKAVAGAKGDALRGIFQDYFLPVKRVQEAIEQRGGQVAEDADVYGREELYYGRTGEQLRQLEEDQVKPLVHEMEKQGVSQEDLELYLYAKFAPDRNAHIASINEKLPDGGSGMTNADAAKIIDDFKTSGMTAKLEPLAQRVYAMNELRMKALEDGGLLSPEEAQMWRSEKNYIPLKGLADGVKDDTGTRLPVGGGFSVGGKEAWKALGRRSRATDILANTIAQTEQSIIRAEKNRVAQALLKLAQDNPNPNLWEVNASRTKATFDKKTGEVKYNTAVEPNAVIAKVGGEEYRINLYDQRLMDSIKNMGAAKVGAILRSFSAVNRFLSLTRTTLAPEFVLSNFARDLQTAAVNLGGEQSAALAAKTVRDVPVAIKSVWDMRRGKAGTGEMAQYAKEFSNNGAMTSFVAQRTVEEQQSKIDSLLKEAKGGVVGSSRKLVRATLDLVEDANNSVENGVRLSAYANARREGMSAQQAARLAKNLTVNFNRKGSAGSAINAMYLFYNASIQGAHRFLRAMKSPKVQATMASTALLGFGLGFYNRSVGGKDDDGQDKWDKIEDFEKQRNMIIMHPDGSYTKIPMPYTYNLPYLLGQEMSDMVFGKKAVSTGAANMTNAVLSAFNPIGNVDLKGDFAEQVARLSTPTVAAPFLDIALNKNFFGGPILPSLNPYDKTPDPDSERFFPSTNPAAVAFARELNRITGGNRVRPGAIDISPASMTYVFDYLSGGTGTFFDRVGTAVGLAAKGEPVPMGKVPFARVFAGDMSDHRIQDTYYKVAEDVNQKSEMARLAAKPGGFDDATANERQEMMFGRRLSGPLKAADQQLAQVRKAIKYAQAQNDDARVKQLKDRQNQIMLRFNTAYFRSMEAFSQQQAG